MSKDVEKTSPDNAGGNDVRKPNGAEDPVIKMFRDAELAANKGNRALNRAIAAHVNNLARAMRPGGVLARRR